MPITENTCKTRLNPTYWRLPNMYSAALPNTTNTTVAINNDGNVFSVNPEVKNRHDWPAISDVNP